jgi:hypothetical protein
VGAPEQYYHNTMVLSRFFQRQQAASNAAAGLGDVAALDDAAVDRRQTTEEDVTELFRKKGARPVSVDAEEEEQGGGGGDEISVDTSNTGDFHRFLADTTDDMTVATSTSNEVMNRIKNDFLKDFVEEKDEEEDDAPFTEPVAASRWGWSTRSKATTVSDDDLSVERSASSSEAAAPTRKITSSSWGVGWRTTTKSTDSSHERATDIPLEDDKIHSEESGSSDDAVDREVDVTPSMVDLPTLEDDPMTPVPSTTPRKGWGWTALAISSKPNAATTTDAKPTSALSEEHRRSRSTPAADDTTLPTAPTGTGRGGQSDDEEDLEEKQDASDDDSGRTDGDDGAVSEESDHHPGPPPAEPRKGWGWNTNASPVDKLTAEEMARSDDDSSGHQNSLSNHGTAPFRDPMVLSNYESSSNDDSGRDASSEDDHSDQGHASSEDDIPPAFDDSKGSDMDAEDDSSDENEKLSAQVLPNEFDKLEHHESSNAAAPPTAQRKGWDWKALVATAPFSPSKANPGVVTTSVTESAMIDVHNDSQLDTSHAEPGFLAHATWPIQSNTTEIKGENHVDEEEDSGDIDDDLSNRCDDMDQNEGPIAANSNELSPPATQSKAWGWKALATVKTSLAGSNHSSEPVTSQMVPNDESNTHQSASKEETKSYSLTSPIRSNATPSWGGWLAKKPTAADSSHDHDQENLSSEKCDSDSSDDMDVDVDDNSSDYSSGSDNLGEKLNDPPESKTIPPNVTATSVVTPVEKFEHITVIEQTPDSSPLVNGMSPSNLKYEWSSNEKGTKDNIEENESPSSTPSPADATPPPESLQTKSEQVAASDVYSSALPSDECDSDDEDVSEESDTVNSIDDAACDISGMDASSNSSLNGSTKLPYETQHVFNEECSTSSTYAKLSSFVSNNEEKRSQDNETNSSSNSKNDSNGSEKNEFESTQEFRLDGSRLELQHRDALVNIHSIEQSRNTPVLANVDENIDDFHENTNSESGESSLDSTTSENGTNEKLANEVDDIDGLVNCRNRSDSSANDDCHSSSQSESIDSEEASEKSSSFKHSSLGSLPLQRESVKRCSPDEGSGSSSNGKVFDIGINREENREIERQDSNAENQRKNLDSGSFSESDGENSVECLNRSKETFFVQDKNSALENSHLNGQRNVANVLSRQLSSESVSSSQPPGSDTEGNQSKRNEPKRGWGWFAKKNAVRAVGIIENQEPTFNAGDVKTEESLTETKCNVFDEKTNVDDTTGNNNDPKRRPWGWFATKNQNIDSDSESKDDNEFMELSDRDQTRDPSHSQYSKKSADENLEILTKSPYDARKADIDDVNLCLRNVEEGSKHEENMQHALPIPSQPDSDESFSVDSHSDDESRNSRPYKLVVKQAPMLRLENVTASTRSKIPDNRDQKKDKTWWFSKKNEIGEKSASQAKGDDLKSSADHDQEEPVEATFMDRLSVESDVDALNFAEITRNTLLSDIETNNAVLSSTKSKKKKKSKGSDISTLMEKNKSTRKVNRHGDEVSVGTLNFKAQEPGRVVVLSGSNTLLDESEVGPRSRPWKKSIRKGPKRSHSSMKNPSPLEDINVLSADIEFLFKTEPFGNDAKSSSNIHLPSLDEEEESVDNDEVPDTQAVLDETILTENIIANVEGIDTLLEKTNLEQRLMESSKTVEIDFDQMWDDVSCDGSTALEFERIKRKKNHEKERKRQRREKEQADKENAARRLRLFERRKERNDQVHPAVKKSSEMQSKLSNEFVDAIHKVFDECSINSASSSVEHSTDDVDHFEEGSANGSCCSIYLPSEVSQSGEEHKSHSSGMISSKNHRNGTQLSTEEASDDGMGTVGLSPRKEKHKGKRAHNKKNGARKGKKRSKRSEIDSSEIFLAEVERLKKPKIFTIASLKQEMIDRRGTSVNFLKKEYVNYRKKRSDRRKGSLDNELKPLDFGALSEQMKNKKDDKKVDMFDSAENKSDSEAGGLGAKLSRWVATEGVTELDDLATVVENPTPTHNIFGAAAALAKNAATMIPDVPTNQEIQALARDAGKGISSAGTTILTSGQTLGSNVAQVGERVGRTVGSNLGQGAHAIADGINQGTTSLGKGFSRVGQGLAATTTAHQLDSQLNPTSDDNMNLFTANFSDMPLNSIQEMEDDDGDDFGLLASHKRGRDDDSDNDDEDGQSLGIRSTGGNRMQFKMGKIKAPKLGKTIKKLVPKLPSMNMRGDGGGHRSGGFRMGGSNKGYGGMGLLD